MMNKRNKCNICSPFTAVMTFPIYRKYPNNKSFFRIASAERFEEVKITGSRAERHVFEAKIFPDRQFIQDMIDMRGGFWVESSEAEFAEERKRISPARGN